MCQTVTKSTKLWLHGFPNIGSQPCWIMLLLDFMFPLTIWHWWYDINLHGFTRTWCNDMCLVSLADCWANVDGSYVSSVYCLNGYFSILYMSCNILFWKFSFFIHFRAFGCTSTPMTAGFLLSSIYTNTQFPFLIIIMKEKYLHFLKLSIFSCAVVMYV